VYLNPAFVGLESGITVSATSRMQWLQTDRGFRTSNFTVETQLPHARLGLGVHVLSDTEGIASLRTRMAGAVLSYTIPGKTSNLHFGFEARMVQKDIDWDKLVFTDQLDPMDGLVNPSSVIPAVEKISYGDLDFGIVWRRVGDMRFGKTRWKDVRSQLGVSIHHLPHLISKSAQGNDSFLNRETRIAPRVTFHGGLIIPLSTVRSSGFSLAVSPNFKLDMQGYKFLNSKENITVGTFGMYTLINNYYLGLLYQNRQFVPNTLHTNAYILTFGGYTSTTRGSSGDDPRLFFGISVDVNTTGVGPMAGSVFEATIRYRIVPETGWGATRKRTGKSSKRILDCKSFF
nr:PorP/SprF family type IX secretion system membrane protein [Saprospiraceae bacterium]